MESGNILFSGVGGQGILLASEVTAHALLGAGYDAKKSEVHGMAQRGGSVTAHLRFGRQVFSPLIEPGRADALVAFEMMEAARYLPFLHQGSFVVVNTQRIAPPAVALGKVPYPTEVLGHLRDQGIEVLEVDAFAAARDLGEVRCANVVMVGALSTRLPLEAGAFEQVIRERVKTAFVEVNLKAFAAGRELAGTA